MQIDYSCEEKLMKLNPQLHKRYCDSLFASIRVLESYRGIFPDYTDHSYLHTLNVLNYCNQLIDDNIGMMNCGEIYTLMMGAALHDSGMGVSENDYGEFISDPRFGEYMTENKDAPPQQIIRDLHHELSGCFIKKYNRIFEIPDEFVFPIIQTARGHRRTDLMDEEEYPQKYRIGEYTLCLPYLAAIIRLADELDISAERNVRLDRSISEIQNAYSLSVWRLHGKIKDIVLTGNKCIVFVKKGSLSAGEVTEFSSWVSKLRRVFNYTSSVVRQRTPYKMPKRSVMIEYI